MRTYWPPSNDAVSASFTPSSMAPTTAPSTLPSPPTSAIERPLIIGVMPLKGAT